MITDVAEFHRISDSIDSFEFKEFVGAITLAIATAWDVVSRRRGEITTPETIASILRQSKNTVQRILASRRVRCTATRWLNGCMVFDVELHGDGPMGDVNAVALGLHEALASRTLVPVSEVRVTGRQSFTVHLFEGAFNQNFRCTETGIHNPLEALERTIVVFFEQLEPEFPERARHMVKQFTHSKIWEDYLSWNEVSMHTVNELCYILATKFRISLCHSKKQTLMKRMTDALIVA